jgi:DNA-directed RNA polymerase subunit beta
MAEVKNVRSSETELKDKLVEKLFLIVNGKTSQGVMNDLGEEVLPKGKKYTQKMLYAVEDFYHNKGQKEYKLITRCHL